MQTITSEAASCAPSAASVRRGSARATRATEKSSSDRVMTCAPELPKWFDELSAGEYLTPQQDADRPRGDSEHKNILPLMEAAPIGAIRDLGRSREARS